MRTLLTSALLLVTLAPAARCQATIPADAAREDILQLGSLLERVHPDPYAGFGGRVRYRTAFQELLEEVPEGDLSVSELRHLIAGFLGAMGDGHTGISPISSSDREVPRLYLPVRFAVSADGIYISDATPDFAFLSGARVIEVEGMPLDEVALRTRELFPSENLAGSRRRLASGLASLRSASNLLPAVQTSLRLTVESAGTRERAEVTMEYSLSLEERRAGPWLHGQVSTVDERQGPFSHQLLDDGRVGYLRLRAMWSRGAFETMRADGRTDLQQWLTYAYDRFLNATPAPDVDEAIDGFPSLIEEVSALLRTVREHDVRDIIVDLRGNDGGFSIVGEPLLYQLFGRAYLDAPNPAYFATRVSEELLALRGQTLGELAASLDRELRMGDFVFDPPRGHPRPKRTPADFVSDMRNDASIAWARRWWEYRRPSPPEPSRTAPPFDSGTVASRDPCPGVPWSIPASPQKPAWSRWTCP
jgi:hypothetical protein